MRTVIFSLLSILRVCVPSQLVWKKDRSNRCSSPGPYEKGRPQLASHFNAVFRKCVLLTDLSEKKEATSISCGVPDCSCCLSPGQWPKLMPQTIIPPQRFSVKYFVIKGRIFGKSISNLMENPAVVKIVNSESVEVLFCEMFEFVLFKRHVLAHRVKLAVKRLSPPENSSFESVHAFLAPFFTIFSAGRCCIPQSFRIR